MQGPMPSKPALIVKITLQQATMTNVQRQDLVLPPMCPASRTNTTVDILLCPEKKKKKIQQQLVERTKVRTNSSWKAKLMGRRII
jgi:hypothetical protein